jgi:hypothetical protein
VRKKRVMAEGSCIKKDTNAEESRVPPHIKATKESTFVRAAKFIIPRIYSRSGRFQKNSQYNKNE